MVGHWVRHNIGFLSGNGNGSIIDQILNSVLETETVIGVVTGHLMISTVSIWVMVTG